MWHLGIFTFALTTTIIVTGSGIAGYGVLAYDQEAHKEAFAWNEDPQQRANDESLRKCGSGRCSVRFAVPPSKCAAFATPANGPAWGGAVRNTVDRAKFAAIRKCQKHAKAKCMLRESSCNK